MTAVLEGRADEALRLALAFAGELEHVGRALRLVPVEDLLVLRAMGHVSDCERNPRTENSRIRKLWWDTHGDTYVLSPACS